MTAVVWNAWSNFSLVSASLSEGVNPDAAAVSSRKVTATIAQYGRVVKITDLAEQTLSLDVINGTIDNLNDCAALSVDRVIQQAIFKPLSSLTLNGSAGILSCWCSSRASAFHAGENVTVAANPWAFPVILAPTGGANYTISCSTNATSHTSSNMSMYALEKVVRALQENNAMEFADGNFKGVARTCSLQDLTMDPAFREWHKYTSSRFGEKGAGNMQGPTPKLEAQGITFYASNNLPKHRQTTSADVSFIWGKGAYGVTEFGTSGQKGFEIIIKRPGPNDTSNALNMYGTVGFKFNLAAKALNVSSGRILITLAKP